MKRKIIKRAVILIDRAGIIHNCCKLSEFLILYLYMAYSKRVQYWIEMSDYDLETAVAMLEKGRYLYVGFMAHQCIEKILKACYVSKLNEEPPFLHDLWRLIEKSGLRTKFHEDYAEIIDELQPLNIEARYPRDKQALLEYLNRDYCGKLIARTKELQSWIKKMC
jgi:HEPN domain-containing protein